MIYEHLDAECIDCTKQSNNNGDPCICNTERICGSCENCRWCIDNNYNGKCVTTNNFNEENCPKTYYNSEKEIYNKYRNGGPVHVPYGRIGFVTKKTKKFDPRYELIVLSIFAILFLILFFGLYFKVN